MRGRRVIGRTLGICAAVMLGGAVYDAAHYAIALRRRSRQRLREHLLAVNGERGLALEAGLGPVVVIVASMIVRARSYLPLIDVFARKHRVIVLEAPGTGRSSHLVKPWSVQQYAQWVVGALEHLGVHDVSLIGHSNSGPVALEVTTMTRRVSRLVLVDSIGARARVGLLRVVGARTLDAWREPLLDLRAWWHIVHNAWVHPCSFVQQVWRGCYANALDAAKDVVVPTVIAWGRHDRTMPPDGALRFQRSIPHARLVMGPASHDWLITHPRQFVDRVRL